MLSQNYLPGWRRRKEKRRTMGRGKGGKDKVDNEGGGGKNDEEGANIKKGNKK